MKSPTHPSRSLLLSVLVMLLGSIASLPLWSQRTDPTADAESSASPTGTTTVEEGDVPVEPFKIIQESNTLRWTRLSGAGAQVIVSQTGDITLVGNPSTVDCWETTLERAELDIRLSMGNQNATDEEYELGSGVVFDIQVDVQVTPLLAGVPQAGAFQKTLQIQVDAAALSGNGIYRPEQLFNKDVTSFLTSADGFRVTILSVTTSPGTLPGYVRNNVILESVCHEHYLTLPINTNNPATALAKVIEVSPYTQPVTTNPVKLNWEISTGVSDCGKSPNYQVQLLRLYNEDWANRHDETAIGAIVDWREALSIETGNDLKELELAIAEGTGYYLWRVRPIGDYYPGGIADSRNWGVWSEAPNNEDKIIIDQSSVTVNGQPESQTPYLFFYEQFDDDKNWIYGRVFTEGEEGTRISDNITYANGLQQARQTQARWNSEGLEGRRILTQTVHDYLGRPALKSLPAPVSSLAQVGFQYETGVLQYDDGNGAVLYGSLNYDAKDCNGNMSYRNPNPVNAGPVHEYYSDNNNDLGVPNADGYAFVRTLYSHDGTGRVIEQGNAGDMHRIGGGENSVDRTVKTYYATAADGEIVALFGDEAPKGEGITKTVTVDPNKVITVSYTDRSGLVIATGMYGGGNESMEEPEGYFNTSHPLGHTHGIAPMQVVDEIDNDIHLTDNIISASKRVVLFEETQFSIDYAIGDLARVSKDCGTEGECWSCDVDVKFIIHKIDGGCQSAIYATPDPNNPFIPFFPYTIDFGSNENDEIVGDCSSGYSLVMSPRQFRLGAGTYVVERRLYIGKSDPYVDEQKALVRTAVEQALTADPVASGPLTGETILSLLDKASDPTIEGTVDDIDLVDFYSLMDALVYTQPGTYSTVQ